MECPFDQPSNAAAITTVEVVESGYPILVARHFADDHSWAFLCGTTDDTEDGRVVGMGTALRMDASLRSIADLPPGWIARRDTIEGEWKREPYREDG